eukprot:8880562-Pyramimonas_sp.AAC.1
MACGRKELISGGGRFSDRSLAALSAGSLARNAGPVASVKMALRFHAFQSPHALAQFQEYPVFAWMRQTQSGDRMRSSRAIAGLF